MLRHRTGVGDFDGKKTEMLKGVEAIKPSEVTGGDGVVTTDTTGEQTVGDGDGVSAGVGNSEAEPTAPKPVVRAV